MPHLPKFTRERPGRVGSARRRAVLEAEAAWILSVIADLRSGVLT